MTSSRCVPSGPNLDDCCSNAFALTNLTGLKWRKYVHAWGKVTDTTLTEDPVLTSFTSALEQDILCAWRHSPHLSWKTKGNIASAGKELWVFWYGEEVNFGGVVSPLLTESSHGCWEDGLPHEPRSLLFKALHNLLERCLLSKRFIRLGQWFVKPSVSSSSSESASDNLSYSFSFFVHGEDTVCTAVEIKQGPRVRHIVVDDIVAASSRAEGVQVLLSPYGEAGFLTGKLKPNDEENSKKLLDDWSRFYPLHLLPNCLSQASSETSTVDQEVPAVVMVVSNEEAMIYPSAYVMIVCNDNCRDKCLETSLDSIVSTISSSSTISLTPPTSPACNTPKDAIKENTSSFPDGLFSSTHNDEKKKFSNSLIQDVWKGAAVSKQSVSKLTPSKLVSSFVKSDLSPQPPFGGEVNMIGQPLWEFEEPFKRIFCACTSTSNISRPKVPSTQLRTSFGFNRPLSSPNHPLPSPHQQQQTQTTMKLKKEKKKANLAFHHRPLLQKDTIEPALKCMALSVMATKGLPTANSITNECSQKRYAECAGSHVITKKYVIPKHNSFTKNSSSFSTVKNNVIGKCSSKMDSFDSVSIGIKRDGTFERLNNNSCKSLTFQDKSYTSKPAQNELCYLLPCETSFATPVLPGNPLDCRPSEQLPSAAPLLPQEVIKPFLVSIKRPPDTEIDMIAQPGKRNKKEAYNKSAGSGRGRNDSASTHKRGRKNSTLLSPILHLPPSPFNIRIEDDVDVPTPDLKSPTARLPRQRRQSSNSSVASPTIEQPKPSRLRNRRQSSRKQQHKLEDKEKLFREQEEEQLQLLNSNDSSMQKSLPSPPTPRQNIPISNLMTDKDLMVTANDLDQLFDDDEDDDDAFKKTRTSDTNFGFHVSNCPSSKDVNSSSQTMVNTGVVASQDLARMFPTPPSLEPVAHSPPCSIGSDYISPGSVKTMLCGIATPPETHPMGSIVNADSDNNGIVSPKELGSVFEIPIIKNFPSSSKFGQVNGLPGQKVSVNATYKPCFQPFKSIKNRELIQIEKYNDENVPIEIVSAAIQPSPAHGSYLADISSVSADSRHYTSLSPLSPASSISSFTIIQSSTRTTNIPSNLLVDFLMHSSSISKVLFLSDSFKNYFCDKNFDNVSLCCCNGRNPGETKTQNYGIFSEKLLDVHGCTCGFLPFEKLKFSNNQGLFPEDELCKIPAGKKKTLSSSTKAMPGLPSVQSDAMFNNLVDIVIDQCSSPFSCYLVNQYITREPEGLPFMESVPTSKAVIALHGMRKLLQEAFQKSTSKKTWEQPATMVTGPLSWKQFHQLSVQGLEDSLQPLPIPSMLVGNSGDWISVSPFSFLFWDKLLLEPFSTKQDVAYVVVAPENDHLLTSTKLFFKELSSLYETCRLGQHVPISKIRDGILRVGQKSLKLCKESVDDWFSQQDNTCEGARVKLYAQVCKYHLAPYLSTLKMDRHLLDRDKSEEKSKLDGDRSGFPYAGHEGSKNGTIGTPTSDTVGTPTGDDDIESLSEEPPTIVVYLVDPFDNNTSNGSYVGLLRCFAEMTQGLTDSVRSNIVLQVVPMTQVLQVDNLNNCKETKMSFITQLKCMAFSVFSRCYKTIQLDNNATSLSDFGPAVGKETIEKENEGDTIFLKLYSCPYILDSPVNSVKELADNSREKILPASRSTLILHCGYCLSDDQRWLLTVCTDSSGEKVETGAISIRSMLRNDGKPYKTSSRSKALNKLFEFCVGVIASSMSSWRLVICKLGRMGQGEIKDWKEILSKTSSENHDSCHACASIRSDLRPTIIGASVIALEPEPAVRLYQAKGFPKAYSALDFNHQISITTIPKPDVSRTYIHVFSCTCPTKSKGKPAQDKNIPMSENTSGTVVNNTDFLLAGDDDENDPDPLQHLFPLLNTSPTPLSPGLLGTPIKTIEENHISSSSPLELVASLSTSQSISSPFQPIGQMSPFQLVNQSFASPSKQSLHINFETESLIDQPLAQGYVVSTVSPGRLPDGFWANYPQARKSYPVILRATMFVHLPELMESELSNFFHIQDEGLNSHSHCDVLKYILQQLDALSWLNIDPISRDRRSCLPVHLCMVSQLSDAFTQLIEYI